MLPVSPKLRQNLLCAYNSFFSSLHPRTLKTCEKIVENDGTFNFLDRFGVMVLPIIQDRFDKKSIGLKNWIALGLYNATIRIASILNRIASIFKKINGTTSTPEQVFDKFHPAPKISPRPSLPQPSSRQTKLEDLSTTATPQISLLPDSTVALPHHLSAKEVNSSDSAAESDTDSDEYTTPREEVVNLTKEDFVEYKIKTEEPIGLNHGTPIVEELDSEKESEEMTETRDGDENPPFQIHSSFAHNVKTEEVL